MFEEYSICEAVVKYWKKAFADISKKHFNQTINESFYRRVMFASFKYAVIYHIILKKEGKDIDFEDMTFALKTALFHLYSLQNMLEAKANGFKKEVKKQENTLEKVKALKSEIENKGGRIRPRDVQRRISAVKTAADARYFLEIIEEAEAEPVF